MNFGACSSGTQAVHQTGLPCLVRKLFSTSTAANNYAIHAEDGDDSEMDDVEEQTDDGDVHYR